MAVFFVEAPGKRLCVLLSIVPHDPPRSCGHSPGAHYSSMESDGCLPPINLTLYRLSALQRSMIWFGCILILSTFPCALQYAALRWLRAVRCLYTAYGPYVLLNGKLADHRDPNMPHKV